MGRFSAGDVRWSLPSRDSLIRKGTWAAYADKTKILVMDFKVKDNVPGSGQVIQFERMYVHHANKYFVKYCTSPKTKQLWYQIRTGNDGHEDTRMEIDPPTDLH